MNLISAIGEGGLPLSYKAGCVPIFAAISGVLVSLFLCVRSVASTGFCKPIYCLDMGWKISVLL